MANFDKAYAITMAHEGGYANHPSDTGGETYKGIARNHNPNWKGWHVVDAAKRNASGTDQLNRILSANADLQANVRTFYKANYWDVNRLDQVSDQLLAEKLFDIGVNMGVGRAARMWQEAVNLTNQNGRAYADIAVDGIVGAMTLKRTNEHPRPALLLQVVRALQGERYLNIMRNAPSQEVFAASWFSRI
ncbi:glycoside hydrolase family 108 protein [Rudanella lutea]|uniref:glycoside hydrolase family 108 protein n=1 Tax=Rudanella lutea TaxID=451374 RepID=UPI0003A6CC48|nr:glycosyl hydrolase 108 family protein [Rudanella lutea]